MWLKVASNDHFVANDSKWFTVVCRFELLILILIFHYVILFWIRVTVTSKWFIMPDKPIEMLNGSWQFLLKTNIKNSNYKHPRFWMVWLDDKCSWNAQFLLRSVQTCYRSVSKSRFHITWFRSIKWIKAHAFQTNPNNLHILLMRQLSAPYIYNSCFKKKKKNQPPRAIINHYAHHFSHMDWTWSIICCFHVRTWAVGRLVCTGVHSSLTANKIITLLADLFFAVTLCLNNVLIWLSLINNKLSEIWFF